MSEQIPSGSYACVLVQDDDGAVRLPVTTGPGGELCVELSLWLYAKGAEQPFTSVKKLEVIDADLPPRGNTEYRPFDFMLMSLKALGATSDDAIDDAIMAGLEAGEVVFPGVPKGATAEISYKSGTKGGSFLNIKILPVREVTDDAKARAMAALKARKAANKPAPNPFGDKGRGTPIAPPKGNPFARV